MKKIALLRAVVRGMIASLILFAFLPTAVFANTTDQPIWLAAMPGKMPSSPAITPLSSDTSRVGFVLDTPGVWLQASADHQTTHVGTQGDAGHEVNGLDLPVYHWSVEIPLNVQPVIKVTSSPSQTTTLSSLGMPVTLNSVTPAPCKCADPSTAPSAPVSQATNALASISMDYVQRGRHIIVVDLRPVQYQPETQSLTLYSQLHAEITFPSSSNNAATLSSLTNPARHLETSSFQVMVNQPLPSLQTAPAVAKEGFVILTPDIFLTALQPLVSLKQSQGYAVSLIPLSQAGGNAQAIHSFLVSLYQTSPDPLTYVFLIGAPDNGVDSLPTFTGTASASATDLYYATLDGADWIPDIYVGRLPAHTLDEVNAYVTREVFFVQNPTQGSGWQKAASFLATCDAGYGPLVEQTHLNAMNAYTSPMGFTGTFPVAPEPGGDHLFCRSASAGMLAVQDAFAPGRSLIVYSGHGTRISWELGVNSSNIAALSGSMATPVVFSFACQTGDFNAASSIGNAWITQGNALAFIGSSANTYWDSDNVLEAAVMAQLFAPSGNTLANALHSGAAAVSQSYAAYGQYYYEAYNVLGDPSLKPFFPPTTAGNLFASTPATSRMGMPNTWVPADISVTNQSNITDTPLLTVTASTLQTRVDLPGTLVPGQTGTARVWVFLPAGMLPGQQNQVNVQIASASSSFNKIQLTLQVMVAPHAAWLPFLAKQ